MAVSKLNPSAGGIPFGNNAGRPANAGIGRLYSNGEEKRLELYTSSGWQNIVSETPGVVSVSGNYIESTGSGTIEITGTNFTTGAIASVIGTNGVEVNANSTTVNSIVSVTAVFSGLSNANEPYDVKVTNTSNLFGLLPDSLYINTSPVWTTSSGSLGIFAEQVNMSVSATATDETAITYSLASGSSLPSGISLNSSTGLISGTLPDVSSNTTYTFTINASDGLNSVVPRTFSITTNAAPVWSTAAGSLGGFTELTNISIQLSATDVSDTVVYSLASGSSLPSGITLSSSGVLSGTVPDVSAVTTYTFTVNASDSINTVSRQFSFTARPIFSMEVLLVGGGASGGYGNQNEGGGGGGAGGVLYASTYSAVFGSTLALSVGTGGTAVNAGEGVSGGSTTFGSFTAIGGGAGGGGGTGINGGSGGGGGGGGGPQAGGSATQTSQSPFTGYGYGGGPGSWVGTGYGGGGGGGGAGSTGTSGQNYLSTGGPGGSGYSSSITGSSVTYAEGGRGGKGQNSSGSYTGTDATTYGSGGQGNGASHTSNRTGTGYSGVIILAYSNTAPALTSIPGTLTYDQPTRSGYRVYRFTAGSGTVTL